MRERKGNETMTKRAKQGGELGANGEHYKGGQFINTIEDNPKKQGSSKRGSGKQEIEPFVWAVAPVEGLRSIYRKIAGTYGRVDRQGVLVLNINPVTLAYYGENEDEIKSLTSRYNAGDRWV